MTLKVVCGAGHVSVYNLTIVPSHFRIHGWDDWRCKTHGCEHKYYLSHQVDMNYYKPAMEVTSDDS